MAELLIPELDDTILMRLCQRAAARGRTVQEEVQQILAEAAQAPAAEVWERVRALRDQLASTGRTFTDGAELLREDRDR